MNKRNAIALIGVFLFVGFIGSLSSPASAEKNLPDDYAQYLGALDSTCQSDADCVIKDVHNCCGYYPACVNVAAAVNPERVQKYCTEQGIASICGFESISGCRCDAHKCTPVAGTRPVAQ